MASSVVGLVVLGFAQNYWLLLLGSALVGLGSAIFHPEASRVARMASGGRHGLAQSLFQVGGNVGSAIGPLLAAFVVLPRGQWSVSLFAGASLVGIFILWRVGVWYAEHRRANAGKPAASTALRFDERTTAVALHRPHRADGDQERLHGEPIELLHVLPDRQVRRSGCRTRSCCCSSIWAPRRRGCSSVGRSATGSGRSS